MVCLDRTYEELKLTYEAPAILSLFSLDRTYEELKPGFAAATISIAKGRLDRTYEELKLNNVVFDHASRSRFGSYL